MDGMKRKKRFSIMTRRGGEGGGVRDAISMNANGYYPFEMRNIKTSKKFGKFVIRK